MTMASWHRGESWTPGSRRSGAEARLALPEAPLRPSPPAAAPAPRSAAAPRPRVSASLTGLRLGRRLLGGRTDFLEEPGRASASCMGDGS